MGRLIEGRWVEDDQKYRGGGFVRQASAFAGPLNADLAVSIRAEPGRYHLIASSSCPWSHRTIITRSLKGLEDALPLQLAHGPRVEGYAVNGGAPWRVPGRNLQIVHMHELYTVSDPCYSGRSTVPVLWDAERQTILSNESARIVRLLDAVPGDAANPDFTLLPPQLTGEIESLNRRLHDELSNAVYRAGLARAQDLYEEAVEQVFAMLEELEHRLSTRRYLFGAVLTGSDLHLLPTLLRFDSVYHGYFRCSRRRLTDYKNLWAYSRDLFSWRGIAATTDFEAIRSGYFLNDGDGNPFGILPVAPEIDWQEPHGRDALSPASVTRRDGEVVVIDPSRFQSQAGL